MKRAWMIGVGLLALANACSGEDDSTGDTGTGAQRDGITECGPVECQAGQYCVNTISCEPGCTSDNNCTSNQTCAKAGGEQVGSCQNTGGGGKDCSAFVSLCTSCGQSEADCQGGCAIQSNECVACYIDDGTCNAGASCAMICSGE
jgi:hypothetical protein